MNSVNEAINYLDRIGREIQFSEQGYGNAEKKISRAEILKIDELSNVSVYGDGDRTIVCL